jgi:hypothetical protein
LSDPPPLAPESPDAQASRASVRTA